MRVLITGGAGFIGSHTADALLRDGVQVRILDSLEEPVHPKREWPAYLDPRAELVFGDVRDECTLLHALQGCDAIFHFAAFQDYLPTFSRFFDVNVTSTALIYELVVREKIPVRKLVVASSQATLGEGLYRDAGGRVLVPDMRPVEQLERGVWELQPPVGFQGPLAWQPSDEKIASPQNPYGMSKIAEENVCLHLGRRYGIPSVALRYSIVQGPRQSVFNAYSGACRVFCLAFMRGEEPTIYEDGLQIRDFVNIQDVVEANLLVLADPRADYQMFNVGGGVAWTVRDFARQVAREFGLREYEPVPSTYFRFGDTRHVFSDTTKLRRLGWEPRRPVPESVAEYRSWLQGLGINPDSLDVAKRRMQETGVIRQTVV